MGSSELLDVNVVAPSDQLINLAALMEDEGDSPRQPSLQSANRAVSFGRLSKQARMGARPSHWNERLYSAASSCRSKSQLSQRELDHQAEHAPPPRVLTVQTDATFKSRESERKRALFKVDAGVYQNAGMQPGYRPTKGARPY